MIHWSHLPISFLLSNLKNENETVREDGTVDFQFCILYVVYNQPNQRTNPNQPASPASPANPPASQPTHGAPVLFFGHRTVGRNSDDKASETQFGVILNISFLAEFEQWG